jgi:hypothetical protein
VLTANQVIGQFNSVELGPDFFTNRVQLTYEPTRVLVTPLPPVCGGIDNQPTNAVTCRGGSAAFSTTVTGVGALTYQWHKDGNPLPNGPTGSGSILAGTDTPSLSITNIDALDLGNYTCLVTTRCGSAETDPASLIICIADVDDGAASGTCDGGVGIEDLLYYLAQYDQGTLRADVDDGSGTGTPDGGVGIEDLLYYLQRFDAGC